MRCFTIRYLILLAVVRVPDGVPVDPLLGRAAGPLGRHVSLASHAWHHSPRGLVVLVQHGLRVLGGDRVECAELVLGGEVRKGAALHARELLGGDLLVPAREEEVAQPWWDHYGYVAAEHKSTPLRVLTYPPTPMYYPWYETVSRCTKRGSPSWRTLSSRCCHPSQIQQMSRTSRALRS